MTKYRSSNTASPIKMQGVKKILHDEAIIYIDGGLKPHAFKNKYLRDAMAKEYLRRLRLEIAAYPVSQVHRYTKGKNILDLSWQKLEKVKGALKGQKRSGKTRKRRKRRRRRSRTRRH